MNLTPVFKSTPAVPSKTCTTTSSSEVSRTCPFFTEPSFNLNCTISPKATGSVLFKKTRGPFTSVIVRYSFPDISIPPSSPQPHQRFLYSFFQPTHLCHLCRLPQSDLASNPFSLERLQHPEVLHQQPLRSWQILGRLGLL